MASNVTTDWVDIANAAEAHLDAVVRRLDTLNEAGDALSEHKEGFRDGLAAVIAHPAAVRLRTLLDTVDATHGQPEQRTVTVTLTGGTADEHAAAKAAIDDLVGQPTEPTEADPPSVTRGRGAEIARAVREALHRGLDVEPCATACTHVIEGRWTANGIANVFARRAVEIERREDSL